MRLFFAVFLLSFFSANSQTEECTTPGTPPFGGTIFINSDIITPEDPTAFISLIYNGQGSRTMFDRRVNDWVTLNPYLFPAQYDD